MSQAPAPIGHNAGPVTIPKEDEMLAHLQTSYPEIPVKLDEFEAAFKTYPEELSLERPDEAEAFQDLLGQVAKERRVWDAHEKGEKGPISKLVKVVTNFFLKPDERAEALIITNKPKYDAYLEMKKQAAIRKANEEADRQRKAEEAARAAALQAEEERRAAEARAAEERRKEQEARAAAERARQEQAEREAAVAKAKEEERRLTEEKRERDRAEKEKNTVSIRDIRANMKTTERLNDLAETEEATEAETKNLDMLVRAGGVIGNLAAEIFHSQLLDEEQKSYLEETRTRLGELRVAFNNRFNKREQTRREKERLAHEQAEAAAATLAAEKRRAEAKLLAEAKAARELEEAAVARAKEERRQSEDAARTARAEARGAEKDVKEAGRDIASAEDDADRAANRADRVETRLAKSTDADLSRTRGDLGTVGRLQRRWVPHIKDEAALRAVSGPLGEYFTIDALSAAAFHFMRARQGGWAGQTRVEGQLAGVVFAYEQESQIS